MSGNVALTRNPVEEIEEAALRVIRTFMNVYTRGTHF
jgi:hypothetical protein